MIVRCRGFGIIAPTATPIIGGIWTKLIDRIELERFVSHARFRGSIASGDYLYRPELNRYKQSGERRRLAVAPN